MLTQQKIELEDGYYTVAFNSQAYGRGHRTFRIRTQKNHEWRGGTRLVSFLAGPDNTSDYMRFAEIDQDGQLKVWARFSHEEKTLILKCVDMLISGIVTDKAQKMYAMQSGHCYKCNRLLTHPESIEQGIGPECGGWTYKTHLEKKVS